MLNFINISSLPLPRTRIKINEVCEGILPMAFFGPSVALDLKLPMWRLDQQERSLESGCLECLPRMKLIAHITIFPYIEIARAALQF